MSDTPSRGQQITVHIQLKRYGSHDGIKSKMEFASAGNIKDIHIKGIQYADYILLNKNNL